MLDNVGQYSSLYSSASRGLAALGNLMNKFPTRSQQSLPENYNGPGSLCFRSWKVITNIIIQDLVGLLRSCNCTFPASESHLPTFCCSASDLTFHHGGSASHPISVTCQIEGEDSPCCGCLWLSIPKHITCCSSSIISPLYICIYISNHIPIIVALYIFIEIHKNRE